MKRGAHGRKSRACNVGVKYPETGGGFCLQRRSEPAQVHLIFGRVRYRNGSGGRPCASGGDAQRTIRRPPRPTQEGTCTGRQNERECPAQVVCAKTHQAGGNRRHSMERLDMGESTSLEARRG